jgi:phosphoribosylformimino-5-aminoimidazole carboxamide ribotide isomerase
MFEIIPAIDIFDGECVRLKQGDFSQKTTYYKKPVEAALFLRDQGAQRIHVIDLNGAKEGEVKNIASIKEITKNVDIPLQVGGGIRNLKSAELLFSIGVERIIIGTSACNDKDFIEELAYQYPGQIVIALDIKNGMIATHGWQKTYSIDPIEFAKRFEKLGIHKFIYTDISRDGMLQGPNFEKLKDFIQKLSSKVYLSGGITKLEEIKSANELKASGCIIGTAIYTGKINLKEAAKSIK